MGSGSIQLHPSSELLLVGSGRPVCFSVSSQRQELVSTIMIYFTLASPTQGLADVSVACVSSCQPGSAKTQAAYQAQAKTARDAGFPEVAKTHFAHPAAPLFRRPALDPSGDCWSAAGAAPTRLDLGFAHGTATERHGRLCRPHIGHKAAACGWLSAAEKGSPANQVSRLGLPAAGNCRPCPAVASGRTVRSYD